MPNQQLPSTARVLMATVLAIATGIFLVSCRPSQEQRSDRRASDTSPDQSNSDGALESLDPSVDRADRSDETLELLSAALAGNINAERELVELGDVAARLLAGKLGESKQLVDEEEAKLIARVLRQMGRPAFGPVAEQLRKPNAHHLLATIPHAIWGEQTSRTVRTKTDEEVIDSLVLVIAKHSDPATRQAAVAGVDTALSVLDPPPSHSLLLPTLVDEARQSGETPVLRSAIVKTAQEDPSKLQDILSSDVKGEEVAAFLVDCFAIAAPTPTTVSTLLQYLSDSAAQVDARVRAAEIVSTIPDEQQDVDPGPIARKLGITYVDLLKRNQPANVALLDELEYCLEIRLSSAAHDKLEILSDAVKSLDGKSKERIDALIRSIRNDGDSIPPNGN